jgi:hypothetical protein
MNESLKVQTHHLERGAYLYIRQSSMRQVLENVESTKRQYALRGRATRSAGVTTRSLSSTATKVNPAPRRLGARASNAW